MSRFISIGGMNYAGERNRERPRHPGAEEFYRGRSETSHSKSGFVAGDEVYVNGEHGRVLHEERDQHTGVVTTWLQASSRCDSGTFRAEWVPGEHERQMVLRETRKTRD